MTIQSSLSVAPDYILYRENVIGIDDMSNVTREYGCNASMFEWVHVQVIPAVDMGVSICIWYWCENANTFIQEQPANYGYNLALGESYEIDFHVMGRIFFIQISQYEPMIEDGVDIMVSGFNSHKTT
jgi:hypothetical protein